MAPTPEKTHDDGAKPKAQDATKTNDSSTGVNYPQSVFSGVRKTVGFKCDTGLYSAFKPVAKAYFGSICHPLECFMLAVLALQKEQVNFGETVVIERLNIERNLRPRRNLVVDSCEYKDCREPAVAVGMWRGERSFRLCKRHLQEAKSNPENWKLP
jgi:hypothetical protein